MNAQVLLTHFHRIAETPDSILRLREFILDLAVRGKLVDQDPNDEPASTLLRRIQAEKHQLVKNGKIRQGPPPVPARAEELAFILRPGWQAARISQVLVELQTGPFGSTLHQSDYEKGGTPVINPASIKNGRLVPIDSMRVGTATLEKLATFKLRDRDIVIARRGEMGRCAVVTEQEAGWLCGTGSLILRLPQCVFSPFFVMLIGSPLVREYLGGSAVGATMQNLNQSILQSLAIGLPPFCEQRRIVAKVDELMALCDQLAAAQAERESRRNQLATAALQCLENGGNVEGNHNHANFYLTHLPRLTVHAVQIRALRQTILNLAVRGRLVHQDRNDEPASKLLERVKSEKAVLIKAGGLKKDKTVWDGLPKKPPHDIPSTWVWACLQDVFEISRGGSPRPAGDPRYFGGSIPWITVGEITKDAGKYLTRTETGLTEEGAARSRFINSGDLLLTNSGATLGVPKISRIRSCMNDGVAVLRLFHSVPLNDFAYLYLQSQTAVFRMVNQGMGQPNLNTPIIAGWFFPLPPLAEQNRIVAKVDELMVVCDQLESQLGTTQTASRCLLEAILTEALNSNQTLDDRRRASNE